MTNMNVELARNLEFVNTKIDKCSFRHVFDFMAFVLSGGKKKFDRRKFIKLRNDNLSDVTFKFNKEGNLADIMVLYFGEVSGNLEFEENELDDNIISLVFELLNSIRNRIKTAPITDKDMKYLFDMDDFTSEQHRSLTLEAVDKMIYFIKEIINVQSNTNTTNSTQLVVTEDNTNNDLVSNNTNSMKELISIKSNRSNNKKKKDYIKLSYQIRRPFYSDEAPEYETFYKDIEIDFGKFEKVSSFIIQALSNKHCLTNAIIDSRCDKLEISEFKDENNFKIKNEFNDLFMIIGGKPRVEFAPRV